MNNADLIVATLKANGITRGFGIPIANVRSIEDMRERDHLAVTLSRRMRTLNRLNASDRDRTVMTLSS